MYIKIKNLINSLTVQELNSLREEINNKLTSGPKKIVIKNNTKRISFKLRRLLTTELKIIELHELEKFTKDSVQSLYGMGVIAFKELEELMEKHRVHFRNTQLELEYDD